MKHTGRNIGLLGIGLGVGAGIMYLFDPHAGRRRRAMLSQRSAHLRKIGSRYFEKAAEDLEHRAKGWLHEARYLERDEVSDDVIVARVRSVLGHHVSHPKAIDVLVADGVVTLSGEVVASEVDELVKAVGRVRGVRRVREELRAHKHPGQISALQGGLRREARSELLQENWSPGIRLLVAGAGMGALVSSFRFRFPIACALGTLGALSTARATSNLTFRRLFGVGAGRWGINLQKTIHIKAPVVEVWDFWINFERYPEFMSHVREVRDLGRDRLRWVVDGPFGSAVVWDAEITTVRENECLAWKSIGRPSVAQAGMIHFNEDSDGGTRLHLRFSYNPPGGALGHGLARLFGIDAKHQFDEDLLRVKSFLESGVPARDAVRPTEAQGF